MVRRQNETPRFDRLTTAELAGISLTFLESCERENLVRPQRLPDGRPGYSVRAVRELMRIRQFHEDLDLNLAAIEVVLNMREQILDLHEQLARLEAEHQSRVEALMREICDLRFEFSAPAEWR